MRVELLGTVQVRDDAGGPVHVGGPRAQALLVLLAVDAGRVVPAVSLIGRLWDGDAPDGARGALQSMVSRLRGVLGAAIESHPAGYRLAVRRDQVDALAFEELAGQGSRALADADPARASAILRQALALWRGHALAGLLGTELAAGIAARLEELRRSATADRIEADLAAAAESDAAGLTAELRALVAEDPLAERPRALLMRALYLAGRQADALAVYADARAQLAAQLGVDPSPQLERVYLGVLRRSLPEASPPEASPPEASPPEASLPEARTPASSGPGAGHDAAVSGPSAAALTTLRVPLTSLVGRDDQVTQVEALTGENRLVTLTGPGGVGKTRLAAEVASRVAARARGGVWLVDLAPLSDPGDVPYATLTAVGIRDGLLAGAGDDEPLRAAEPGASPAAGPSARLASGLRERSGLIVLDNCEHLIDAVAGLADAVLSSCPAIRILAASREALGITGETVCPVPPLPVPPDSAAGELAAITAAASVRLLADRARAVRPGFAVTDANASDVARICRVLDGMPLAIELAAARLRTMSPAQLTGRLGDRFAVLTGGSRTALPRHQTLRAAVEWSWELLSKPERVLARRLAVLPAGATLGAAEGICSDEPDVLGGDLPAGAVLDALTGLADKSFLTVDGETGDIEPRYRMLDTIRAYCLERLAEADEEDGVRHRMCGYYLAVAETADPLLRTRAQRPWFGVLAAESANMQAALRWAIERSDAATAVRFGAALAWYWYVCGQRGDCAALARAALALDPAGSPHADRATAEARAVCAVIAASADWDLEPAGELLDAAVAAGPGGRTAHPLVVYAQSQAVRFGGDGERALELLAGYLDSADPWTGAAARLQSAVILRGLGRIEEASLGCDAALAAFRDIEESWGIAAALMFRAELDKTAGDYRGAIAALEDAMASGRQLGAPDNDMTWLYSDLAWLRVRTGDYAAAHAVLDLAEQDARARGDSGPYPRLIRAELAWREGHLAEATRLCEDILRDGAGAAGLLGAAARAGRRPARCPRARGRGHRARDGAAAGRARHRRGRRRPAGRRGRGRGAGDRGAAAGRGRAGGGTARRRRLDPRRGRPQQPRRPRCPRRRRGSAWRGRVRRGLPPRSRAAVRGSPRLRSRQRGPGERAVTLAGLAPAQHRGLFLQREDLGAEPRVRVKPEPQHLLHVRHDEVVQDDGGRRAQRPAQQRQRRIASLVTGGRGRPVHEEEIDPRHVLPGPPRVPRVGLALKAEALQRGVPHLGEIADVMPGQEVAGLAAENRVVIERDDPAVDPEPPHRQRQPQRGRAAAAFHDERRPFADNQVDQHHEQVWRRGPAPGGGQHVAGRQQGVQVLQRFQLTERLPDLFLDLIRVGLDPPHGIERAHGFAAQVADPAGQVEAVPDQQQQAAEQRPQRHQGYRRHRARAGGQPEPERASQPRGDQHGYRLDAHELPDQAAHGGLLHPA